MRDGIGMNMPEKQSQVGGKTITSRRKWGYRIACIILILLFILQSLGYRELRRDFSDLLDRYDKLL